MSGVRGTDPQTEQEKKAQERKALLDKEKQERFANAYRGYMAECREKGWKGPGYEEMDPEAEHEIKDLKSQSIVTITPEDKQPVPLIYDRYFKQPDTDNSGMVYCDKDGGIKLLPSDATSFFSKKGEYEACLGTAMELLKGQGYAFAEFDIAPHGDKAILTTKEIKKFINAAIEHDMGVALKDKDGNYKNKYVAEHMAHASQAERDEVNQLIAKAYAKGIVRSIRNQQRGNGNVGKLPELFKEESKTRIDKYPVTSNDPIQDKENAYKKEKFGDPATYDSVMNGAKTEIEKVVDRRTSQMEKAEESLDTHLADIESALHDNRTDVEAVHALTKLHEDFETQRKQTYGELRKEGEDLAWRIEILEKQLKAIRDATPDQPKKDAVNAELEKLAQLKESNKKDKVEERIKKLEEKDKQLQEMFENAKTFRRQESIRKQS